MSRCMLAEIQFVAYDVCENFARLRRFQCQIETLGGLCALVAQDAPDEFVFTGPVFEDQGTGRMPELVHGDAQPSGFLDPIDDLRTERNFFLVPAGLTGKQPIRIAATDQSGPEVMHILA